MWGTANYDPRLAEDPRVTNMEHVNARALTVNMFPEAPSLAVMDVSFISIRLILPAALSVLGAQGRLISLIKPQFEAGKAHIGKHGVISNPSIHADVLKTIVNFAPTLGWHVRALDFSPIAGTQGNLEFLADFQPGICPEIPISDSEIECLVRRAHDALSL